MEEQAKIVAQDFEIWENKSSRAAATADGRGPILEFRLWARQFYSEHRNEAGRA